MKGCIFCEIVSGKVHTHKVYEDYSTICVLDIHPVSRGHCLLLPKNHVKNMFDMDENTFYDMKDAIKNVIKLLKKSLNASKIKVIYSSGEGDDDKTFHFHVHLIPHYEGENRDYLDRKKYKEKDLELVMTQING